MGHEHYPLAESMLLIGFFLMYFLEELIHYVCDSKFKSQHVHEDEALKEQCEMQTKRRLAIHRQVFLCSMNEFCLIILKNKIKF